ncbi:hypothetical protein [Caballeronia cordobensis]|nr:hypothetical protein BRPE67_BCDS10240 [Burkholderia sp. RPE67]
MTAAAIFLLLFAVAMVSSLGRIPAYMLATGFMVAAVLAKFGVGS